MIGGGRIFKNIENFDLFLKDRSKKPFLGAFFDEGGGGGGRFSKTIIYFDFFCNKHMKDESTIKKIHIC